MYKRRQQGPVVAKSDVARVDRLAPVVWDEDAQRTALRQAKGTAQRDPEAAALLLAHLDTTPAHTIDPLQESSSSNALRSTYNAMRCFADMAKYYRFGHLELRQMDYRAFFGYMREMNLKLEEENAAYEDAKNGTTTVDADASEGEMRRMYPQPTQWNGQ